MSKGSLFWGNGSGKLGETVLYRSGGEQRTRTYVAKIKNPKTLAQMNNRLLMNNVVSAFRALKPLMQQTFPNRKANQSAFNAFVKANKVATGFYIGKADLESNACVPYGMTISKGNLGVQLTPSMFKSINAFDTDAAPRYGWQIQGLINLEGLTIEVNRGDIGDPYYIPTDEELYTILKERAVVALPAEFQLSVVSATYAENDTDLEQDMWQPGYRVYHLQAYGAYHQDYNMADANRACRICLHIASQTENSGTGKTTLTFDKVMVGFLAATPTDIVDTCVGVVLSFKDSAGYQVSTSKMASIPTRFDDYEVTDPAADYRLGGFYYEQLLSEYGYSQNGVLTSSVPNVNPNGSGEGDDDDDVVVEED